jgi:hypothetical protein
MLTWLAPPTHPAPTAHQYSYQRKAFKTIAAAYMPSTTGSNIGSRRHTSTVLGPGSTSSITPSGLMLVTSGQYSVMLVLVPVVVLVLASTSKW